MHVADLLQLHGKSGTAAAILAEQLRDHERAGKYLPDLPMQILSHFLPSPPVPTMEREDYYLTVSRLERAKGIHTILPLFRANGPRLKITGASDGRRRQEH